MKRKIIAVVLVVLAAMSFAFAGKGDSSIGVQIGSGADAFGMSSGETSKVAMEIGFYLAGSYEYGLSDSFGLKAEAGINSFSKMVVSDGKNTGSSTSERPMSAALYAGFVYDIPIGREGMFAIDLGAGVDTLIFKVSKKAKTIASVGIGFDTTIKFNLSDNVSITSNARIGVPLLYTDESYKQILKDMGVLNFTMKSSFGVVYTL